MSQLGWESSDGKISKDVLVEGVWGTKPYEASECLIRIKDCPEELEEYNDACVIVGDFDSCLGRCLDSCITTMHQGETSRFTIELEEETVSFEVTLVELRFNGFIYEWAAKKKYEIAQRHKVRGIEAFSDNRIRAAAYRFTKGLKIIMSIPIDVQCAPKKIDGLAVSEIKALKCNFYNNLASCYLRNDNWEIVIEFCSRVLREEGGNVKALYKIGVAYRHDKNYEKSEEAFLQVLKHEPAHKSAKAHLQYVQVKLKEAKLRSNDIMKRMIGGILPEK